MIHNNVQSNNNKDFIPDLMEVKLEPFQASFILGDEPLKYIDFQTSKQEPVQKRFHQKSLYNKQGKFSRALSCLLETHKLWQNNSDDDFVDTPVTPNNTIDISKIDFNISFKKAKIVIPPSGLKSKSNFCDYLFEEDKSIPKEITDSVQLLNTTEHNLNPLDGSDYYTVILNCIEVMNDELGDNNNGDLDIDWYDLMDIFAVQLRNDFIQEGFSK